MLTLLKYVFYAVILFVVFYIGAVFYSAYWDDEPNNTDTIVITES